MSNDREIRRQKDNTEDRQKTHNTQVDMDKEVEGKEPELIEGMNKLIHLVLKKQEDSKKLEKEYEAKLKNVTTLVQYLLDMKKTSVTTTSTNTNNERGDVQVDTTLLDEILRDGLKFCEQDGVEYCMIPVVRRGSSATTTPTTITTTTTTTTTSNSSSSSSKSKKKKNKIHCSYCAETGHTRAKCPKILMPGL